MSQDYFSKSSKSLSQMSQDYFSRSSRPFVTIVTSPNFLANLKIIVTNVKRLFFKVVKTSCHKSQFFSKAENHCHKCHKIIFKVVKISCHNCHKSRFFSKAENHCHKY